MVSLTRAALAHFEFAVFPGRVGDAIVGSNVSVGENFKGVCVGIKLAEAVGVSVLVWAAFCAAIVKATAVAIAGSLVPGVLQAASMIMLIDNIYFL